MTVFDMLSFLLVLSGSFILTISAGWGLLKLLNIIRTRAGIKRMESQTRTQDLTQGISPRSRRREIRGKQGMLRRVFAELRPYSVSILVLLRVSLSAIPITLITPLPIKLIVDNVLGTSALPGYLSFLIPGGSQASKDYVLACLGYPHRKH